jgi:hypothetical protein
MSRSGAGTQLVVVVLRVAYCPHPEPVIFTTAPPLSLAIVSPSGQERNHKQSTSARNGSVHMQANLPRGEKDLGRLTMRVKEIMEGMSLISRITGRTII